MSSVARVVAKHCVSTSRNISMASVQGVTEKIIFTKLTDKFKPNHLEVINESYKHNVPKGSETHFVVND